MQSKRAKGLQPVMGLSTYEEMCLIVDRNDLNWVFIVLIKLEELKIIFKKPLNYKNGHGAKD